MNDTGKQIPEILTPAEAAPLLRCHVKTVFQLIRDGKLKASRYGSKRYRIQKSAIAECLAATEVVTEAVTGRPALPIPSPSRPSPTIAMAGKREKIDRDWWKAIRRAK